jgi:trk system potassium uptake protein TrkA
MHLHDDWYGKQILLIDKLTSARVAFITREVGIIPDEHTVLQQGDLVHVMVAEEDTARVEAILANSPERNHE